MKILVVNGSPKIKRSNTLHITNAFLDGIAAANEAKNEPIERVDLDVAAMKIAPCKGCFACWKSTPGVCVIQDDMTEVIERLQWADLIVWSFPLYYFSVPGILKNLIDRQLPMSLPFMSDRKVGDGSGSHDARYEITAHHVLISSCGFYSAEGNYDSVTKMFNHFLGPNNYTTIFTGQGELFRVKELSNRTDAYLDVVRTAGREYNNGGISTSCYAKLNELLFPRETFEAMADASWGVNKESGKKDPEALIFTRQMAALFKKESYDGEPRILEMNYIDLGETYQIELTSAGSKVHIGNHLAATTRINTTFELWTAIGRGEIEGPDALGEGLYSVTGDFSLMINWDKFFTSSLKESHASTLPAEKTDSDLMPPSMMTLLIPWITFWIAVSIDASIGSLITLGVAALMPLIMRKRRIVIWDHLSFAMIAALSIMANLTQNGDLTTNLGYLGFGLLWLGSCFTPEPLCATYVKYSYGGERAKKNPIFMRTNYILAAAWGGLYLLTALWTFVLRRYGFGSLLLIINNLVPAGMGFFTSWFQRWYPAWVASGRGKR